MSNLYLKYGSLNLLLVKFFLFYVLLLFVASLLGHGIYALISGIAIVYNSILSSLLFALVVSSITTLIYRAMLKDIFCFLTNDHTEIPHNRNISKTIMKNESFQIDNQVASLKNMGLLITYINRDEHIIKMRQKLVFLNGCGALLYYDRNTKELTLMSFSLFENTLNDYSEKVKQFSTKLQNQYSLQS
jgi:hypothetical protein